MNTPLQTLETVMRDHLRLHTDLLTAAERKRDAIITGNIDLMEQTLAAEYDLIRQVEAAETLRATLMEQIRQEWALEENPLRMRTILEHAPTESREALGRLHEELRTLLDRLRYRSRQNAELLQASMEHVNAFLRLVQDATRRNPTYGREGQREGDSRSLINRVG